VRQKGSHVRMRHEVDPKGQPVTIPLHDEIAAGTLKRILRDAGLSAEQLLAVL
jgi:predicted RNA binding protein YcfA (HicA-like mRNA interferase family)